MRIFIVGAGEVGKHLCEQLSIEKHEVVLVDRDAERLRKVERELNIMTVQGNGASARVLEQAGVDKADLFIAVTDFDEVNLISCILAQQYGVRRRVARVKNEDYRAIVSPLSEHQLGIDLIINPDQAMAEEILKISALSEAFEMVDFAHGEVVVLGYHIREGNPLCGVSLAQLRDLRGLYDFLVVAIVRDGNTLIPRGNDEIRSGDRIYVALNRQDMAAVEDLLGFKSAAPKKVFIIGGGEVGFRVAKALEDQDIDVSIVESDHLKCERLAEGLANTVVLNFDGLDAHELVSEGIEDADLVIAVTNGDTTNILASLLAKHHGAKKCITRISRPDFIPLLGKLGIDVALSPRLVAAKMILQFVRRGAILSVATLLGTDAEVMEFVISERWAFTNRTLKDARFPVGVNVGAIVRHGKVLIPSGETVMKAGDRLVIFSMRKDLPAVEKFLTA